MGFFDRKQTTAPANATEAMQLLKNDISGAVAQTKYQIPANIMNDEKAMVMHLINSNQLPEPLLKMIMPKVNRLLGK